MLVNYKLNHIVANIRNTISHNPNTPISCKFLLKFTHNLLVVNCGRNLTSQSYSQGYSKYRIFTLKKYGKCAIAQGP